jgi:putative ATP-binding cassette transporter
MYLLARQTKKLNYFQQFYGQVAVIIPICVLAPSYFAAAITFGVLMQAVSIMSTVLDNLSYGINSFGEINRLLSCKRRLKEAGVI